MKQHFELRDNNGNFEFVLRSGGYVVGIGQNREGAIAIVDELNRYVQMECEKAVGAAVIKLCPQTEKW